MAAAVVLVTTGGVARAQSAGEPVAQPSAPQAVAAQPEGFHEHDGFFFRMEASGGDLSDQCTSLGARTGSSGGAGGFPVAVGAAPSRMPPGKRP